MFMDNLYKSIPNFADFYKSIPPFFTSQNVDSKKGNEEAMNLSVIVNENSSLENLAILGKTNFIIENNDLTTLYQIGKKHRDNNTENPLNDYSVEYSVILHYIANGLNNKGYEREAGIIRGAIEDTQKHFQKKFSHVNERLFERELKEKFYAIEKNPSKNYKKIRKTIDKSIAELRESFCSDTKAVAICYENADNYKATKQLLNNSVCNEYLWRLNNLLLPQKSYAA